MNEEQASRRAQLTKPRAAAIAGVLFSVLLIAALVLIRISIPSDPRGPGDWLVSSGKTVTLALNLVPFAGIAFLWFIGVVRDRLGDYENKLFSTVFLGSGLRAYSLREPVWQAGSCSTGHATMYLKGG